MKENLEKYKIFLSDFTAKVKACFEEQKGLVKCKSGCSYCCENINFHMSALEYEYLKIGAASLGQKRVKEILNKCEYIKKKKLQFIKNGGLIKDFLFACPFLEDNNCSVYEFRPLICHTYGLLARNFSEGKQKYQLPYCIKIGLNYSDIWDFENQLFSKEKAARLNIKTAPKIYDLGYYVVLQELSQIGYGELKMVFEWIIQDTPGKNELGQRIYSKINEFYLKKF
jgi:Fe-S-cluster containining protein